MEKAPLVFLVGDSCTDIFTTVRMTNRINPEDSSTNIYAVEETQIREGMASNVYQCLTKLGIDVIAATNRPSEISKTRIIDYVTGNTIMRMDSMQPVKPADINFSEIDEILLKEGIAFDAIVISDYDKGYITTSFIKELGIKYSGIPIFLDTKKRNLEDFSNCIIKINQDEARKANSIPKGTIITLGENGVRQDGAIYKAKLAPINTKIDTCGAGDAFLAGLVYGVLINGSPGLLEGIANSSVSILHLGTYAPSLEEFMKALTEIQADKTW